MGSDKNVLDTLNDIKSELQKLRSQQKDILSAEEGANYLGVKLSHFYKMTMDKKFPHFKPGGKLIYVKKEDLHKYMLQNEIKSQAQIESEAATYNTRFV
ncbi:helix-turn-helix domain-containing protein [Catalinimonas sp. 4WD22]|uniref:helix-turn-helix domain-containing protein n=1 Tax=Catalinimonas locisalis TaxID=3133978 RepID=UPI003100CC3E